MVRATSGGASGLPDGQGLLPGLGSQPCQHIQAARAGVLPRQGHIMARECVRTVAECNWQRLACTAVQGRWGGVAALQQEGGQLREAPCAPGEQLSTA